MEPKFKPKHEQPIKIDLSVAKRKSKKWISFMPFFIPTNIYGAQH